MFYDQGYIDDLKNAPPIMLLTQKVFELESR